MGVLDFHTIWKTYIFMHHFILMSSKLFCKMVLGHTVALPETANIIGHLHSAFPPPPPPSFIVLASISAWQEHYVSFETMQKAVAVFLFREILFFFKQVHVLTGVKLNECQCQDTFLMTFHKLCDIKCNCFQSVRNFPHFFSFNLEFLIMNFHSMHIMENIK